MAPEKVRKRETGSHEVVHGARQSVLSKVQEGYNVYFNKNNGRPYANQLINCIRRLLA